MVSSCATPQTHTRFSAEDCPSNWRDGFPAHWWEPVPRDGAPAWEILPQDAGPCEVILSKRNELGILSNFAATPITIDGTEYPGVEGFWQMMKFPEERLSDGSLDPRAAIPGFNWTYQRAAVAQLTGFEAKKAGDQGSVAMKKLGINWVSYRGEKLPYRIPEKGAHYALIVQAMESKLARNPEVAQILARTGRLILRPDHTQGPDTPPAWRYYDIWMDLRE